MANWNLHYAIGREMGFAPGDLAGYKAYKFDKASDGKSNTTFTASVVSGVPETKIQEVAYAIGNELQRRFGVARGVNL